MMRETRPKAIPSTVDVTADEARIIAALAEELHTVDPVEEADRYILEAQCRSAQLPERVRRELLTFRRFSAPHGALVLRGLPTGWVPPTPVHGDLGIGVRLPAAAVMCLVAAQLGDQFGFQAELSGSMVQDIVPVAGFEDTQQSISSRSLLQLHCETAFTEHRADFIGLFAIRSDPEGQAGTLLSPIDSALRQVDPELADVLWEPRFTTTVDASFLRQSGFTGPIVVGPISVLTGSPDKPRLRCDFAETHGVDDQAEEAIRQLHKAATSVVLSIHLDEGDLAFIDNHRAFHGRTPFRFHGNGRDRWLLRSFITRDLARSIADRPRDGRIVDIDYDRIVTREPALADPR
jgi:L-asparagine oxygenase